MPSTKLHMLLDAALLDQALAVLESDTTNMATVADENGDLPIHKLLSGKLATSVKVDRELLLLLLKRLVAAYPESVKKESTTRELPILMVNKMDSNIRRPKLAVEVILALATAWPESLLQVGRDPRSVRSPLRTVLMECSYDYFRTHEGHIQWKDALFDQMRYIYPNVLEEDLKNPYSIIRKQCIFGKVLLELERRNPELLRIPNPENGHTLFHDMASSDSEHTFIEKRAFFQRNPEGLKVKNKSGKLPISLAAEWGNLLMEKAMAEAYPESLHAVGPFDPILNAARPLKKMTRKMQEHLAGLHAIRTAANPAKQEDTLAGSAQEQAEEIKLLGKQIEELRRALSATRSNEQHLLKSLLSSAQDSPVPVEGLKDIARSILNRLVATGSSRSTAQIMLPSLLKDDEATKEDLIHVILSLNAELPNYEVDHTEQVSHGDKHNRSSDDSETASKRARVSV